MPNQTGGKKSSGVSRPSASQKKPQKRARIEAASGQKKVAGSSAASRASPKAKPAVSFAQPAGKKTVRVQTPADPSSSSTKPKAKKTLAKSTPAAKQSQTSAIPPLPKGFTIVVGSYEKLLYGIEGTYNGSIDESETAPVPALKPVFIFPAHVASVKAVAASPDGGKWLATGSSDEVIKVWDLVRRKEVGGLMQHQGSITHLSFASRSHLVSASEDGTIALFHSRDWSLLVLLKGHKGRVNSVAVHPTGKLALSVGKDRALRMWDLMRGKPSASTLLGKEGELVRWSKDGSRFVVQTGNTIDVYQTDMTIIQTIKHPSRIQDVRFCRHPKTPKGKGAEELLFVAAEDKKVSVYARNPNAPNIGVDAEDDDESEPTESPYQLFAELVGHPNRVKSFDTLKIALPSTDSADPTRTTTILASASSDGKIHVYDLSSLPLPPSSTSPAETGVATLDPIAVYDTKGTRLTCLTLAGTQHVASAGNIAAGTKRKAGEAEGDEDEEDEDESEEEAEGEDENDVEEEVESD